MKTILTAVGLAVAALTCAPVAAADVNISGLNLPIGDGKATASIGNVAAAFNGGEANATGGVLNVAIANGGGARVIGGGSLNLAVAQRGLASVSGNSHGNIAVAGPDSTASADGNGNIVFARGTLNGVPPGQGAGSQAQAFGNLNLQVAFCGGTAIAAQGDHINVSAPCIGRDD